MNESMKKAGGGIVTLVIVLVWGGMTLRETAAKDTYNEFSTACSQPLAEQDTLLDEIQAGVTPEKVPAWITKSESIQTRLEAVPSPNAEIEPLKAVLVERAECLSEAMKVLKLYLGTEDVAKEAKFEAEFKAKCNEAGQKLDEFVVLRNAYLKKYDLKLE